MIEKFMTKFHYDSKEALICTQWISSCFFENETELFHDVIKNRLGRPHPGWQNSKIFALLLIILC